MSIYTTDSGRSTGNPQEANRTKPPATLAEAVKANLETGVLLLCKEALITAIQDRRLERGHLRVLAAVASFMNSLTAKAWPGRAAVAVVTGMSVKAVSNTMLELRNWGYLIADREAVEEANHRRLTVYTFGNIDHETIRREITAFVQTVRDARSAESLRGEPEVPAHGDVESPRPRGTSPPTGTSVPSKVPAHGERKSPPTGDSNSKKELEEVEGANRYRVGNYNKTPHMDDKGNFVVSDKHSLYIPAKVVASWRQRFHAIADLESQMALLAAYIVKGGINHVGWTCPEGWMAGCLAKDHQKSLDAQKITNARMVGPARRPAKPSRW